MNSMIKPQTPQRFTLNTLKGFRDFLPQEMRKRQFVIERLKSVFEQYGFEPLETPSLEYEEILLGKYGDEGDKLIYRFNDRGGRKVALRYDQTVPLARVVAQYQHQLAFPFKRYQIQPVWRAENTQKGRFREFMHCDVDIVGCASMLADAEIAALVSSAFKVLGFGEFNLHLNDRSIFANISPLAIRIIDKLKKIGDDEVRKQLNAAGITEDILEKIKSQPPTATVRRVQDYARQMGVLDSNLVFDPTLARGLDYYTGVIIEVEVPNYSGGSLGGGGRYDGLIGLFSKNTIPAVGFAFGFDRIVEAMDELRLFPQKTSANTGILVTIFNSDLVSASIALDRSLKDRRIPSELYLDENAALEKQLKYADKKGIPYAVVIGPEEKEKDVVTLKNLRTREQKKVDLDNLIEILLKDN